MHRFGDYGFGMGGGGGIFMILFWVLIIVALVYLVKTLTDRKGGSPPVESVEEVLKKRYAKGEISAEEYEKIRKHLQG